MCTDSVCLSKVEAGWPAIATIDGNSTASDGGDKHATHRFADALVISGQNLDAGVVGADAVTSLALRAVNGGGEREVVLGDAASFDTGNRLVCVSENGELCAGTATACN